MRDGMSGNRNTIIINGWSNPASAQLYASRWPEEPICQTQFENGSQCGGCSFYATLNKDWGLCAHPHSRHYLETVLKQFTCPKLIHEGWGPHSFTEDSSTHCRCQGEGSEYWDRLVKLLGPFRQPNDA